MRTQLGLWQFEEEILLLLFLHVATSQVLLSPSLIWHRHKETEMTSLLSVVHASPKPPGSPFAPLPLLDIFPLQCLPHLHFCVQCAVMLIIAREWVCTNQ